MTGHNNGLITLALKEADDVTREKVRTEMGEPYRTLLGHFRHEIGHYFWDRLVANEAPILETFRALFGDERQDYGEALKRHYAEGPPENWQNDFVSLYASSHPWEDFAETWAHCFHMVDGLETAKVFGINPAVKIDTGLGKPADPSFDPYRATNIRPVIASWVPLTVAINSLNRSLGQPDFYPFVLTPVVITKIDFVLRLIVSAQAEQDDPFTPQSAMQLG
jgi:hypothetical protein